MPLLKFGMKEIKTLELSFILFGWGLSVNILLLLSGEGGWEFPWAYRAGRGRKPPPPFVGQTKPVGQYSLHSRAILAYYKNNGTNYVNFVGNSVNFGENMLSNRNFS